MGCSPEVLQPPEVTPHGRKASLIDIFKLAIQGQSPLDPNTSGLAATSASIGLPPLVPIGEVMPFGLEAGTDGTVSIKLILIRRSVTNCTTEPGRLPQTQPLLVWPSSTTGH